MHNLLEQYLAEVSKSLGPLPAARRDEEIREMRQHLLSVMTALQKLNQPEDEANANALKNFGTPQVVGKSIVGAWYREKTLNRRSFWGAAVCTLFLGWLLPFVMTTLVFPFEARTLDAHHWSFLTELGFDLLIWGIPTWFLIGFISGILFPRRALKGTSLVMIAWISLLLLHNLLPDLMGGPYELWRRLHLMRWHFVSYQASVENLFNVLIANFLQFILQALAAILGAWIGSRGRGRQAQPTRE